MTVKAQGGKVITKGGKVSCSCCAEPECCMYPAQELADGLFSSSDLPSSVIIDGIVFSVSGTSYGNTVNGVILEGNVWAKYTNGSRSSRPCLLQGGVEDQFADTYTVSWPESTPGGPFPAGSDVVERVSLCEWLGSKVKLNYKGFSEQFGDIFNFQISEIDSGGDVFKDRLEGEYANTPIGFYFHGGAADLTFLQLGATVS